MAIRVKHSFLIPLVNIILIRLHEDKYPLPEGGYKISCIQKTTPNKVDLAKLCEPQYLVSCRV